MKAEWSKFQLLTAESIYKHAPREAGIYCLWAEFTSGRRACYYASQAEDLKKRLLEHLGPDEPNPCIGIYRAIHVSDYVYAVIPDPSDRNGVVKFLYDRLRPECSDADPGGSATEVNLPLHE